MEPPVSVAVAAGTRRAATAAAEPPEEPPGTSAGSQGLRTGPKKLVSFDEPIANSSMFSLPSITVPAALRPTTTVASYGDTKSASIFEPQVVRTPSVQKMSLWAIGTPVSGPARPAARASSAACAAAKAPSAVTVTKALRAGWPAAMRSRQARVSSTLEYSPRSSPRASPATVGAGSGGKALIRSPSGRDTGRLRLLAHCVGRGRDGRFR